MIRPALPWKLLAVGVVGLLTIALGLAGWAVSLRDRRWAAMEHRVAELRAGLDAPPLERVPLGRETIPGNAWDDYLISIPGLNSAASEVSLNHLLYGRDGGEEAKPLIEKHADCIDLIRRAARRRTCKAPPPRVDDGLTLIGDDTFAPVITGAALGLAKAHLLAEQGRSSEALELALDVYLCGRDFAGTRIGRSRGQGIRMMDEALNELTDILRRRKLDPETYREWERRLTLLDRYATDNSAVVLDNLMEMGECLLHQGYRNAWLEDKDSQYYRQRWRYFFLPRLQAASHFEQADAMVRRALALERTSWAEASPVLSAFDKERNENLLLTVGTRNLLYAQVSRRHRTELRIAALAARYLATGEVGSAECGYGTIQTRLEKGFLLIWAVDPGEENPPPFEAFERYSISLKLAVPARP